MKQCSLNRSRIVEKILAKVEAGYMRKFVFKLKLDR